MFVHTSFFFFAVAPFDVQQTLGCLLSSMGCLLSAVCCACVLAVWACELAVCPGISNTSIGIFFRGPSGPTLLAALNITGQNITYSTLLLTSNVHPCCISRAFSCSQLNSSNKILPKRSDIFPPDWGMLRRSRCVQIFL